MKVVLVSFLHLDELPPMMTVLKVLSKVYKIVYIGVDDFTDVYRDLYGDKVEFVNIIDWKSPVGNGLLPRCIRYLQVKEKAIKYKAANSIIEKYYDEGDILWVHHEYTLMSLKRLKIPYYLTMYELHPDLFRNKSELKNRVKSAQKVIVPEYARAAIVKACVGLENMPLVVQNKPYDYDHLVTALDKNPMIEIAQKAHAENKRIVLYSGIFLRERKLDTIIEAVQHLKDKFEIVLVGRKSPYLEELLRKYPNVIYLGFFNPPHHLEVIEKADVGILTYVADSGSINPVFCAPNKIWEYARYGIPMICNDIPGLKYTVEYNGLGYCCDINSVECICDTLNKISDHYELLSEKAHSYYKTVDIEADILRVVVND